MSSNVSRKRTRFGNDKSGPSNNVKRQATAASAANAVAPITVSIKPLPASTKTKSSYSDIFNNVKSTKLESGIPLTASTFMQDPNVIAVDFTNLVMKEEPSKEEVYGCSVEEQWPLTVCPNGYIFLDTTLPNSKSASDFLIAIAEPVSRPELIHEFQITIFSLYAGLSMGLSLQDVLNGLEKFSKNEIPEALVRDLKQYGGSFGKVKLVLREGKYFLESPHWAEIRELASNEVISQERIKNSLAYKKVATSNNIIPSKQQKGKVDDINNNNIMIGEAAELDESLLEFVQAAAVNSNAPSSENNAAQSKALKAAASKSEEAKQKQVVYSFEVSSNNISAIKEEALRKLQKPLLTEYDFKKDTQNPSLEIGLKPTTKIRYYQERALRKMFFNGRARSGMIVLPCGAGKTLTGITAATTIKKSTMVLTSSSVAVDQWKRSFLEFTTIDPSRIVSLTADSKSDLPNDACVVCSTYTMMAYSGRRSEAAERIMNQIKGRDWGLLIFDEVQFAPAPAFRKINDIARSHCKLGLTATLVREDDLINDLQWLIGPKLDEANWLELQEARYLAKAKCSEVWCPMTLEFYRAYLGAASMKQRKLWVCNPNKLRVCEYLIKFHEARQDKVIVFSDNLFALKEVAFALKKPFISGEVSLAERMLIINEFKTKRNFNTIFLSKVGDNAIDIPCANVVVQISFNFASRRQETQRLGRILRPKPASTSTGNEFNAFFYSLVSKNTQEMAYADKRQQYIIDQGYAYKVLPMSVFPMKGENLVFTNPLKQKELLAKIMMTTDDSSIDVEEDISTAERL